MPTPVVVYSILSIDFKLYISYSFERRKETDNQNDNHVYTDNSVFRNVIGSKSKCQFFYNINCALVFITVPREISRTFSVGE